MCTYNITVDDKVLKKLRPTFTRESFGKWLQQHVDNLMEDITAEEYNESPIAHTAEEMKAIVIERLKRLDSGESKLIPSEEVYAQIRERYGFEG
ncbi:MAG: addiction module protein [Bacteroidales bacterium]|nr:addiction module protein [Bacteroidales bacterium]